MFVIATISPPAFRMRSATMLSVAGTKSERTREPACERDPRHADRVFQGDALPREDPRGVGLDPAPPHDCVVGIFASLRTPAGVSNRLENRGPRQLIGFEGIEDVDQRVGDGLELLPLIRRDRKTLRLGEAAQFFDVGLADHWRLVRSMRSSHTRDEYDRAVPYLELRDGVPLYYEVTGDGPTIVLVPGGR